jgi:hypothetical protein
MRHRARRSFRVHQRSSGRVHDGFHVDDRHDDVGQVLITGPHDPPTNPEQGNARQSSHNIDNTPPLGNMLLRVPVHDRPGLNSTPQASLPAAGRWRSPSCSAPIRMKSGSQGRIEEHQCDRLAARLVCSGCVSEQRPDPARFKLSDTPVLRAQEMLHTCAL